MARARDPESFSHREHADHTTDDQDRASHQDTAPPGIENPANFPRSVEAHIDDPRVREDFATGTTAKLRENHNGRWELDDRNLQNDVETIALAFDQAARKHRLSDRQINEHAYQIANHMLMEMTINTQVMEATAAYRTDIRRAAENYRQALPEFQEDIKNALARMATGDGMDLRQAAEYITVTLQQTAEAAETVYNGDRGGSDRPQASDRFSAQHDADHRPQWAASFDDRQLATLCSDQLELVLSFQGKQRIAKSTLARSGSMSVPNSERMTEAERHFHSLHQAAEYVTTHIVQEMIRRDRDPNSHVTIHVPDHLSQEDWAARKAVELQRDISFSMRESHFEKCGFAVVTDDAIRWLHEKVGDTPMIELGAGTGLLSKEMQERGINVTATEPASLDENQYRLGNREHTDIERLNASEAIAKYPDHSAVWSWPENEPYVSHALSEFSGKHLALIGENGDGCTGPGLDLVVAMNGEYRYTGRYSIPKFWGVNDALYVVERIDYQLAHHDDHQPDFQPQWDQITAQDLDRALQDGTPHPELLRHIVEAAAQDQRVPGGYDETDAEYHQRSMAFSVEHIAKATVSDAMAFADPGLRQALADRLEQQGTTTEEWAKARVRQIVEHAQEHVAQDHAERFDRSIITTQAIESLHQVTGYTEFLQVEAGNAYLSDELSRFGMNVIATDRSPRTDAHQQVRHHDETRGIMADEPYRSIVWSWPQDDDTAQQVMSRFSGEHFVYVGDPTQTLDPAAMLDASPENYHLAHTVELPGFTDRRDVMMVFQRLGLEDS